MACSCILQHFRNFKELSGRLLKTSDKFFLAFLVLTVISNVDPNPLELQNALSVILSTKIIHIHIHIHTACLCQTNPKRAQKTAEQWIHNPNPDRTRQQQHMDNRYVTKAL
jgi:uncharacterized membrane protein